MTHTFLSPSGDSGEPVGGALTDRIDNFPVIGHAPAHDSGPIRSVFVTHLHTVDLRAPWEFDVMTIRERGGWFVGASVYTLFVIYGSLVPLEFAEMKLADAWAEFVQVPYLDLRIYSRADWVANGVLFVPAAFLWLVAFSPRLLLTRLFLGGIIFLFLTFVIVAVEFAQVFVPPRTVSQNDIYSEVVGSALGVLLWLAFGDRVKRLVRGLSGNPITALEAFLAIYTLVYLAVCLFPFDFFLSLQEFRTHLAAHPPTIAKFAPGWGGLQSIITLLIEVAVVMPIGRAEPF